MDYFYADGDAQKGPVSLEDLARLALKPDTLVWREGMGDWQRADSVPELIPLVGTAAPGAAAGATPPQAQSTTYAPPGAGGAPTSAVSYATHPGYPQQPGMPQAPGQPLPYGGYGVNGPSGAPASSALAITSMILGILSIPGGCCVFAVPLAVTAVILGHIAMGQIKRGQAGGYGMALAGLICGYIGVGIVVLNLLSIPLNLFTHH